MFGRNTYLHHPRPTTVDGLDGVEILLHHHQYLHHHHHHQLEAFPGLFLAANAPPPLDTGLFNQDNGEPSSKAVKKQTTGAKKDRHSKIHTAQGPRDRRVRLSIGIARKFFDLQEMLGFDKPSKTLDWLLTKSKAAIKELVQKKQSSSSSPKSCSSPTTSACELVAGDMENTNGGESKRKLKVGKEAAVSLAKESRAKARARARERTLEKMCFKQLSGGERCNGSDLINPSFEGRNNHHNRQLEFLQLSNSSSSNNDFKGNNGGGFHFPLSNDQDLIEESRAMIKRKHKNINNNTCSLLGFQQNHLVFSTDLNSNYMNQIPSANNAAAHENWDNVFGLNSHSNLHAVLDQHKFFNSNSNI